MDYAFITELLKLAEDFGTANRSSRFAPDINGFKDWLLHEDRPAPSSPLDATWESKDQGRKPESVISTLIVHMNRYAKTYSRSAIHGSPFSTQEEFIYLITLKAYGEMTKTELIRKNVQDKPAGMLIVNRLIRQGWIKQVNSAVDKRSKVLQLTPEGAGALQSIKVRIDRATKVVSGDLTHDEKMELIRLLQKLERFHKPIFEENIDRAELLDRAMTTLPNDKNRQ